jgi:hypothetical protein
VKAKNTVLTVLSINRKLVPKPAGVGDQLQPLIYEPPKEKKRFKTVTNEKLKDL